MKPAFKQAWARLYLRCGAVAALFAGLASAAWAADPFDVYAKPQRLVALPDGRRLNLLCEGSGGPTVILEGGWSDSTLAWRRVQPLIAAKTRVCSYDRAGLGFSDPTSQARDTLHIVEDLEALLKVAELRPPYVIVGYSMGGLSARLFTDRNRERVSGLVLVEPSVEFQAERFRNVLPGRLSRPLPPEDAQDLPPTVRAVVARQKAQPSYQHTILAELVGMQAEGSRQVAASRRAYGTLPLIVLTASDNAGGQGYSASETAVFKAVWNRLHDEVASLSSVGEHRQVTGATHMMVFEQPGAVARAVDDVIARRQHGRRARLAKAGCTPRQLHARSKGLITP